MEESTAPKVRTNLYLDQRVKDEFQSICVREKENMSLKIEKFMRQYNQAHTNGNPQLKISTYAKLDEPSPLRVLCDFLNGALSDGQVHCRRRGLWVKGLGCYSCEKNQLRKTKEK